MEIDAVSVTTTVTPTAVTSVRLIDAVSLAVLSVALVTARLIVSPADRLIVSVTSIRLNITAESATLKRALSVVAISLRSTGSSVADKFAVSETENEAVLDATLVKSP
jgi:hypothetical protein